MTEMDKNMQDIDNMYNAGMLSAEEYKNMKAQLTGMEAPEAETPPIDKTTETPPPDIAPSDAPKIHVKIDGKDIGQFDKETVIKKIRAGEFKRNARVWKKGMSNWVDACDLPELENYFNEIPPDDVPEEAHVKTTTAPVQGKLIIPKFGMNGEDLVWEGGIVDGKPCGKGTLTYEDGTVDEVVLRPEWFDSRKKGLPRPFEA